MRVGIRVYEDGDEGATEVRTGLFARKVDNCNWVVIMCLVCWCFNLTIILPSFV